MASETRQDPERIYLEPAPYSPEGRLWCADDVWPLDGDGPGGVEYVRADLHDAEIARLTRELKEAREILRDLADDEDAGIVWTGTLVVCAYCYATDRYDVEHVRDCPIERARRALVATPDAEGET